MNIVVHTGTPYAPDWRAAFAAALPHASVTVWPEVSTAVDYLAVWRPPVELFTAIPAPRAIFNLGAGVDSLLALSTLPCGVPVIRLEDAGMAVQMAEYVTLATLAAFREQHAYAEQQRQRRWAARERLSKRDFGVGLLGVGVLGQAVAAALLPLGFPVYGWCRSPRSVAGVQVFSGQGELDSFLAQARVLVCLLPSTSATRDLLDRDVMRRLPRGAHVINIARGDILVDADLVALLDEGHLSGATLDVFRDEPLPPGHPFWHHPKIDITPHVAALTLMEDSVAQIAAKIQCIENGLPVTGIVDRARGY